MFTAVKSFVTERRNGFVQAAGVVGGLYVARRYVGDRLNDAKERMEQERIAQDILKRRFQQNQDDISFTILALLPTMAEQILEEMNVEAITQEIQRLSKERNAARQLQQRQHLLPPPGPQSPPHPHRFDSSLSSSVDLINDQDARSDTHSVRSFSTTGEDLTPASGASSPPSMASSVVGQFPSPYSPPAGAASPAGSLADSITSINTDTTSARSKAELWNEVKILTLTRTLTTVYSITLLSLLTSLQLTLLARSKYIHSVLEDEREERLAEQLQAQYSWSNLLIGFFGGTVDEPSIMGTGTELGGGLSWEELTAHGNNFNDGDFTFAVGSSKDVPQMRGWEKEWFDKVESEVQSESQSKYLTMSWWILHVGWKDLKERVRRGVEEVFEGVSLKSKLSAIDLHRLVRDVRRRVEHEVTFEGTEKRTNFLSSLLPQTPETIQHVLVQGGFKPSHPVPSLVYPSMSPPNANSPYIPPSSLSQDDHDHDHSARSDISGPTSIVPPSSSSMYAASSSSFSLSQSISVEPSPSVDPYLPAHLQNNYTHPEYFASDSFKRIHQDDRGRSKSREKGKERETTRERSQSLSSMHSHLVDPPHPSHSNRDSFSSLHHQSTPLRPHLNARKDPDPTFTRLLTETRETIRSQEFGYVLEVALDQATDMLFEGLEKNVFVETLKGTGQEGAEGGAAAGTADAEAEEVRIRFAGLLPGLARWSRLTMETVPNEFVDKVLGIREVECLSAIVFGKFEDQF